MFRDKRVIFWENNRLAAVPTRIFRREGKVCMYWTPVSRDEPSCTFRMYRYVRQEKGVSSALTRRTMPLWRRRVTRQNQMRNFMFSVPRAGENRTIFICCFSNKVVYVCSDVSSDTWGHFSYPSPLRFLIPANSFQWGRSTTPLRNKWLQLRPFSLLKSSGKGVQFCRRDCSLWSELLFNFTGGLVQSLWEWLFKADRNNCLIPPEEVFRKKEYPPEQSIWNVCSIFPQRFFKLYRWNFSNC